MKKTALLEVSLLKNGEIENTHFERMSVLKEKEPVKFNNTIFDNVEFLLCLNLYTDVTTAITNYYGITLFDDYFILKGILENCDGIKGGYKQYYSYNLERLDKYTLGLKGDKFRIHKIASDFSDKYSIKNKERVYTLFIHFLLNHSKGAKQRLKRLTKR